MFSFFCKLHVLSVLKNHLFAVKLYDEKNVYFLYAAIWQFYVSGSVFSMVRIFERRSIRQAFYTFCFRRLHQHRLLIIPDISPRFILQVKSPHFYRKWHRIFLIIQFFHFRDNFTQKQRFFHVVNI